MACLLEPAIDMLNLEWFRTFKAIYETGNLSSAAQVLFISQTGVSLHLNALEAYTGHRLFNRNTRKAIPTDHGIILYNSIIDPLNRLTEAEELFRRNSNLHKPTIRFGLRFETFEYTLAKHVTQLSFNLTVRFGEYAQLLHDIDIGELDLALISEKGNHADFEYTPFVSERVVLVCGSETDTSELKLLVLAQDRLAIQEWLKQQAWYSTAMDMEYLKKFWWSNFKSSPDLKPNYVVPHFSSILRCMQNGKGFTAMPDFLCKSALESGAIKLAWEGDPCVENMLHFVKRKQTRYAIEIKQLVNLLKNNWFCV